MQTIYLQSCSKQLVSISANMRAVDQIQRDHQLIKDLVDWAGGVPKKVADAIGVSPSTINRHYNGSSETKLGRDTLEKLRERFPNYPKWQLRNNNIRSEVASFGDRPFDEKFGLGDLPAIPVVGSAMGIAAFDPEQNIETTEVDMADVLDHVARPKSLASDDRAYAVTVVGDSMYPRFRPGRRVIVSPKAPVSIGDDVIVQLKSGGEDERITLVLIKELVRRSASYYELRQFNPDVTFKIETARVAAIHKVIGEVY